MDASPAAAGLPRRQVLIIFSGIMLGMLLAAIDQTIVATALPTIVGDLGGLSHLSWVVTAYLLTSTVATPSGPTTSELTTTVGAIAVVAPNEASVGEAVAAARGGFDGFVGIGGGSALDTAKLCALFATYDGDLLDYVNAPIGAGRAVHGGDCLVRAGGAQSRSTREDAGGAIQFRVFQHRRRARHHL